MANTHKIIEEAKALGKLIASHDVAKKMEKVVMELGEDTDAQRLLKDYQRHLQAIQEKESSGKPIEVDDKRRLEALQQEVIQNKLLRDLQMTQMDYLDLLRRVDDAIQSPMSSFAAKISTSSPPVNAPLVNPDNA